MKKTMFLLYLCTQLFVNNSSAEVLSPYQPASYNPILENHSFDSLLLDSSFKHLDASSNHCKCASGKRGPRGKQGPAGATGPTGSNGLTGATGATGSFTAAATYVYTNSFDSFSEGQSVFTNRLVTFNPTFFGGLVFDPLTGFVTVPVAGYYQLSYGISISGPNGGSAFGILKNGTGAFNIIGESIAGAAPVSQLATLTITLLLNQNDTISVGIASSNGATLGILPLVGKIGPAASAFLNVTLLEPQ